MSGFSKITIKAGDGKLELDIDSAQQLMMKLEEVLRVEHATIEFPKQKLNMNSWIYFPTGESISVNLLYIPLVK